MSFITSNQILAHLIGDFFLQNDWMATNKKDKILPCLIHVLVYTVPFMFLTLSPLALLVIAGTHFAIDHWGLPRYLIWARNQVAPKADRKTWEACSFTGFSPDRPVWLTVWLLIIVDNTIHLVINAAAIKWL
jgi:hypothetical protein